MSNATKSRIRLGLGLFAGLVVVVAIVWLAVNVLGRGEAPAPRWTQADLPELPPEADNAWLVVEGYEPRDTVDEGLAELPRLDPEQTEPLWASFEPEQRAALRELMDAADAVDSLALVERARGRSTFVSRCGFVGSCGLFNWHRLHELAIYRALDLVFRGSEAQAIALVTDLVRLDRAHLTSASSWLSLAIALNNINAVMIVADALVERGAVEGDEPSVAAGLAGLVAEVALISAEAHDLGPVVIGEYLLAMEALDVVLHPDQGEPKLGGLGGLGELGGPRWLFDPALTRREIDERFAERYEAAGRGDVSGALGVGEVSPKQSAGWWLRNPVGDVILELMMDPLTSLAGNLTEDIERLASRRAQLLGRPAAAVVEQGG